jgi:Zn-dependent protease
VTRYLIACLIALVVHELAHIAVALANGLRVKRVGISWRGPYVVREKGSPRVNACVALAGPVANLALTAICWHFWPLFAEVNLILGGYNLIPFIPKTDGRHAWQALRAGTGR